MTEQPEIAPRKERRAFGAWLLGAVIVLAAAIFVAARVLGTHGMIVHG
jgi:hypothetical protein